MNSDVELKTVGATHVNKGVLVRCGLIAAFVLICAVFAYSFYVVFQFHRHIATFQKQAVFLLVSCQNDQGKLSKYKYGTEPQHTFIPTPLLRYHRSLSAIGIYHLPDSDPQKIDELFDLLPYFSKLKYLSLEGLFIDQQRARQIPRLTDLNHIAIKNCHIEKFCLEMLLKKERLEKIGLPDCVFEEAELNVLNEGATQKTLRSLNLSNCKITDAGAAIISRLRNLEYLSLDGTQITDQGLKMLARLPRLKVLILDHTNVTDSGLIYLASTPNLVELSLSNTSVTDEMLETLKKEIPALRVSDD